MSPQLIIIIDCLFKQPWLCLLIAGHSSYNTNSCRHSASHPLDWKLYIFLFLNILHSPYKAGPSKPVKHLFKQKINHDQISQCLWIFQPLKNISLTFLNISTFPMKKKIVTFFNQLLSILVKFLLRKKGINISFISNFI